MPPLSILHALDKNRTTTGSVVQMLQAAAGLARRGHQVTVAGRTGGDLEDACASAGLRFLPLPIAHQLDLASARRLRAALRSEAVQIVHVHKGRPHSVALLAALRLGALPALVVNRGVSFPLDLFNRWKYRHPRVAAVVCVAEAIRRIVIDSGGVPAERVHTVYAGTDTERFAPAAVDPGRIRAELGVDEAELLVGQVAVRDWKGWHELLRAFARVAGAHPRARILFVGCEPEAERTKVAAAAARLGLAGRLLTLPYRRDLPDVLAACTVVADASWAGTGITGTIREAMALERAVVATDCAGNAELVSDDEVGLLVPPRDEDALATALDRLLGDAELRRRLGVAARRRVVRGFSVEHRLDRLENLYRNIVAQRG